MKLFKYILCLFCAISLTACHQDEKQDFWEATIDAVQSKSKDNAYLKNNWNIGISSDEGKKHQNMAARYIVENDNETTTTIFALQNQNDKEYISYTYTTDVIEDTKEYQKTITINSTNKKYTKYDIQYNYYEFENGNYTYGEDATGSISINKDGITYDNVPLLNEAIQSCCTIIDDFQEEFDIDYEEYDFDPLPYQMKDLNIPSIDEIQEETATSTDYYGEQRINAKGYTLVDCLSIDKDTNEATYSTFNYERQSDEESIPCTLSLQGNNIYLLTPDMDIDLTISFDTDRENEVKEITGRDDLMYLSFSHHGALPGPATIKTYVGNKYKDGDIVYLYYFNEEQNRVESVGGVNKGLVVKDGYVEYTITHCSLYFLSQDTAEVIKAVDPDTADNNGQVADVADTAKDSAATGDTTRVFLYVLETLMAAVLVAGLVVADVKKNRINR